MANPFSKPISKVSAKELLGLSDMEVGRLDAKESVAYEKRLRSIVRSRIYKIKKAKEYSPAIEAYFPEGIPKLTKETDYDGARQTRSHSQHNIAVLRQYLEAKTSTVSGIKKERERVATRIFGKDKSGRPVAKFTNIHQERRFWRAYHEFIHQKPLYGLESTRVQQFLGKMTFWRRRNYTADDFDALLKNLEEEGHPGWSSVRWGENIEEEW